MLSPLEEPCHSENIEESRSYVRVYSRQKNSWMCFLLGYQSLSECGGEMICQRCLQSLGLTLGTMRSWWASVRILLFVAPSVRLELSWDLWSGCKTDNWASWFAKLSALDSKLAGLQRGSIDADVHVWCFACSPIYTPEVWSTSGDTYQPGERSCFSLWETCAEDSIGTLAIRVAIRVLGFWMGRAAHHHMQAAFVLEMLWGS